ncbi:(Uracil-5)-methyltransferase [Deinococcus proteolyticus MRP]|uniref:(Uracil-5)-methyltransferase n=1 Tax=Deinococcus proteolyticus (strain ATCC 35074 / DSM 20540 / JCM 6276 / NBRC 101906 / NCIMB 13154 / VKM Ac-1939 / CCM 2703 / MRP) TaxID=693977 RepID=F0RN79_DEIPM|nr:MULTISPECIES: methyltransferase [Deinococcus]ADY26221.1 (Uracil-5)-methyltransferase [Deinococcus proteolyticus MRP]MCY1702337.1 methyltransferase [Deinococcus sp. SL84]
MQSLSSRTPAAATYLIEKVVSGGLGLARDESGVVLIRGALPGERVRAEIRSGKGVRQGHVTEVLEASPDRVARSEPALPTTDLAHASYAAQLRYKRDFVVEALTRIGKLSGHRVEETVPSPAQTGYRSGAQYLVTPQGLAYRERREHRPRLVEHDPLIAPFVAELLSRLDPALLAPAGEIAVRGSFLSGEVVAALIGPGEPRTYLRAADHLMDAGAVGVSLAAPAGKRFSAGVRLIAGESTVPERFGDVILPVSAVGFSQVNPAAAGLAYLQVAELAGQGSHAADLYGGAGAIGRHLTRSFEQVTVLDSSAEALTRGRQAAGEAEIRNITFQQGAAEELEELSAEVIVVDPPRAGLDPAVRGHIHASTADRLVYVSCDPATWARDVGDLVGRGWKLGRVVPHDFYPQTSHVEVVSVLER